MLRKFIGKYWILIVGLVAVLAYLLLIFSPLRNEYVRSRYFAFLIIFEVFSWFLISWTYATATVHTINHWRSLPTMRKLFFTIIIAFIITFAVGWPAYELFRRLRPRIPDYILLPASASLPFLFFLCLDLFRLFRGKELLVKQNMSLIAAHIFFVVAIIVFPLLGVLGEKFSSEPAYPVNDRLPSWNIQ